MPTFVPRRYTLEAHQWRGFISELPPNVSRMVELQGWRPALVHIGDGTRVPLPDGSWIVLGPDGRPEVLPDGAFQHRYKLLTKREGKEHERQSERSPADAAG